MTHTSHTAARLPHARIGRRLRYTGAIIAAGLLGITAAQPASALELITSSITGKSVVRFGLGGEVPVGPLAVSAKLNILPNMNDVLGTSDAVNSLLDGEALLLYKFNFDTPLNAFGITPTLAPYAGVRYMGAFVGQAENLNLRGGYNQLAGASYGLRAILNFPLGLTGMAYAGGSTFMWGRWGTTGLNEESAGGAINPGGATVPVLGAQVNWSPLNLFTVYAGAETSQLPDFRGTSGLIGPDRATLTTLRAGLSFLFFSI